ncbi:hypothetical protein [Clostridium tagluense]|uniref:Uncharacterized protein n=1 Tax=Clostridium tagluense TaxID=360422 RepID=A0A401ULJ3_9CLOT|nr:hypothetical protein [Clostridium tagluense]GCD10406.1 hypothetical protein Ctaglu_20290 [Clostridium tagluense]
MTAGKRIGNNLYIHRSVIANLSFNNLNLVGDKILYLLKHDFKCNWDIIRINLKEQKVAFIISEDWDTATEPQVGDSYCVDKDNIIHFKKACGQIYHHKWKFVQTDYKGFDVKESIAWSEKWLNSDIVKKLKADPQEKFNCKIGYKKYFDKVLRLIEEDSK